MKHNLILASLTICVVALACFAQTPQHGKPESTQKSDDEIIRVTTNLIQVDASVTDKNGKPIPNLRAEDFEILVNGKPQKITNFLFIGSDSAPANNNKARKNERTEPTIPSFTAAKLRHEQVRRSIALVIDDIRMSHENMTYVRRALKNFVDAQMEPGDLVAILRVGKGNGVLQRFTADKRELYSVIEKLRFNLMADRATGDLIPEERYEVPRPLDEEGRGIQKTGQDKAFVGRAFTQSTIAATNYVVTGMSELPGRKAVLLISEGFPLDKRGDPLYGIAIREAIKRLVDSAARSGVVVSTMNPSGLIAYAPSDVITSTRTSSQQIAAGVFEKFQAVAGANDGLIYLAKQTGGLAIYNSNDLKAGIRDVLDDLRSYYLIGFQPEAGLLDQPRARFHQLRVEVKVSGVNVRYRSGFFGIRDRLHQPALTSEQQIVRALASPFGSTEMNIRLTPLFTYDQKAGSLVRALVHISTDKLTFVKQSNGAHQATINILACTFDNDGAMVDSVGETHTLTLPDEWYRRGLNSGFVYSVKVPIKKTGDYQLRVAVQDAKSLKTGTASQFITIPDVKKGRLALSGIALSSYDPRAIEKSAADESGKTGEVGSDVLTKASARRFRASEVMQFAYSIYNASIDRTTSQPRLTTRVKLFRDGKQVYASADIPFEPGGQPNKQGMLAQDSLRLAGLEAGDYVLQVSVVDISGRTKNNTATNWIDFEVIN